MKYKLPLVVAFAGLLTAAISVQLAGASGGPPTATIGPYHFQSNDFKIDSKSRSDVVMPSFTILPGHSNHWHVHPGPGYIIVTAGTLTLYRSTAAGCERSSYGPGEGFVEAPGQVHIARNEGTTALTGVATFLDVPAGTGAFRTTVPAPDNCPGIN